MNWFLDSKLTFRLTASASEPAARQRVLDFLKAEGFRDVVEQSQSITARRGAWRQFFLGGDPRRIPHVAQIEGDKITYKVASRFLWFTAADNDVFRTEARILAAFMEGRAPEGPTMAEVQKFRFKTDLRNTVVMCLLLAAVLGGMLAISHYYKKHLNAPMAPTQWFEEHGPRPNR